MATHRRKHHLQPRMRHGHPQVPACIRRPHGDAAPAPPNSAEGHGVTTKSHTSRTRTVDLLEQTVMLGNRATGPGHNATKAIDWRPSAQPSDTRAHAQRTAITESRANGWATRHPQLQLELAGTRQSKWTHLTGMLPSLKITRTLIGAPRRWPCPKSLRIRLTRQPLEHTLRLGLRPHSSIQQLASRLHLKRERGPDSGLIAHPCQRPATGRAGATTATHHCREPGSPSIPKGQRGCRRRPHATLHRARGVPQLHQPTPRKRSNTPRRNHTISQIRRAYLYPSPRSWRGRRRARARSAII